MQNEDNNCRITRLCRSASTKSSVSFRKSLVVTLTATTCCIVLTQSQRHRASAFHFGSTTTTFCPPERTRSLSSPDYYGVSSSLPSCFIDLRLQQIVPPSCSYDYYSSSRTRTATELSMCQLLGMNCARPTDFTFSFTGFSQRGGNTDKHRDGWGLAFYEGRGVRTFHDSAPCATSPIANFVKQYPSKTLNMVSHIRYATQGGVALENVHPFQREMWGIQWIFAHNGDVPKFKTRPSSSSTDDSNQHNPPQASITPHSPWLGDVKGERVYNSVGDTDSEAVFCAILNALRAKFDHLPTMPVLYEEINRLTNQIVEGEEQSTIFNFLLACGEHVQFAYSWPGARPGSDVWNGLFYTIREPPFKMVSLMDCDSCIDFSEFCNDDDRVAVVATAPLTTDEAWIEVQRGQLVMFDEGKPHIAPEQCLHCETIGHGLQSKVLPRRYKVTKTTPSLSEQEQPALAVDPRHTVTVYGGGSI
jgi:predicted glutamine amidotransferase